MQQPRPPVAGDPAPTLRPPTERQRPPAFVGSNLKIATIKDGDGLAAIFKFIDQDGNECPPIVLTNELGIFNDGQLADMIRSVCDDVAPAEVQPVVLCGGCGTRIFGDLIPVGRCQLCRDR